MTSLLSVATAVSCFVNLLLFIAIPRMGGISRELFNPQKPNFEYSNLPQELPRHLTPTTQVFHDPDSAFAIDDDAKWATIVPHRRGFIRLGADGTPFSIATYHQLHCLNTVRFAYRVARDGLFKTPHDRDIAFVHANHCFDVLRQTLLCKADTTVWPVGSSNETAVERRCGNPGQVMDFVRGNQAFWEGVPYKTEDAVSM
ncbi:hypothetical protein C8R46DRAFT_1125752 [Mycena filopes]|nr:hypothetical protein C8R46DRAFT_1125752 [Mycena filopes]